MSCVLQKASRRSKLSPLANVDSAYIKAKQLQVKVDNALRYPAYDMYYSPDHLVLN